MPDQDETFFHIVGYTSGGAPYGVTWEEMEISACEEQAENEFAWNAPGRTRGRLL